MKKSIIIVTTTSAAILAAQPAHAILGVGDVVSDPLVEANTTEKNVFDQLEYAWEQTQWAEQLSDLANTLNNLKQQLDTANQIKQAIGDPAAAAGLVSNGAISGFLQNSGITNTLSDLSNIAAQGAALSSTIQQLWQPINIQQWTNLSTQFEGLASFRDPNDPLARFRAVENAFTKMESILTQAAAQGQTLKTQIAQLTVQVKGAQSDAEAQKLIGSLNAAQSALTSLDGLKTDAQRQVQSLQTLNKNRKDEEDVANDEISRQRNQQSAQVAAAAEVSAPDLTQANTDIAPGF